MISAVLVKHEQVQIDAEHNGQEGMETEPYGAVK